MELQKNKTSLNLIAQLDPKSPAAEAYRSLRTSLAFASVDGGLRAFIITSPGQGDGKTTTACNLAISLAQSGKRVLLVDADLRKPRLARYFNQPNTLGLTHLLTGEETLSTVVRPVEGVEGLHLLTNGRTPPNPAELLGSKRMGEVLDFMRDAYDFVLLDTPPCAHLADAVILGHQTDGALLVISAGESNIDASRLAKKHLDAGSVRILGAVFAKVAMKGPGNYYYYYTSYGANA